MSTPSPGISRNVISTTWSQNTTRKHGTAAMGAKNLGSRLMAIKIQRRATQKTKSFIQLAKVS